MPSPLESEAKIAPLGYRQRKAKLRSLIFDFLCCASLWHKRRSTGYARKTKLRSPLRLGDAPYLIAWLLVCARRRREPQAKGHNILNLSFAIRICEANKLKYKVLSPSAISYLRFPDRLIAYGEGESESESESKVSETKIQKQKIPSVRNALSI